MREIGINKALLLSDLRQYLRRRRDGDRVAHMTLADGSELSVDFTNWLLVGEANERANEGLSYAEREACMLAFIGQKQRLDRKGEPVLDRNKKPRYRGLMNQEIAETMGCSERTIRRYVKHSLGVYIQRMKRVVMADV